MTRPLSVSLSAREAVAEGEAFRPRGEPIHDAAWRMAQHGPGGATRSALPTLLVLRAVVGSASARAGGTIAG